MTQDYYGTKRITAWPATGEDGQAEGYAVKYADGYTSWSPKDVFEAAYQPLGSLSFGHALVALKAGHRVARAGWNGKGMWLAIQEGSTIAAEYARGGATKGRANEGAAEISILPHIDMRAADGSIVVGWLASQTDMLADDWTIVGGEI
ncbi:DUF2829 domain-containing protein [Aurantimonas coralicida]|uniref:DUF2829 domain-containing protein n=1 Tax=Aurantimonas coralicida TaxID=182270 RepID=UPI00041B6731|nr:DUF2829 domain-containing protein [Aurantimonas coralicida]